MNGYEGDFEWRDFMARDLELLDLPPPPNDSLSEYAAAHFELGWKDAIEQSGASVMFNEEKGVAVINIHSLEANYSKDISFDDFLVVPTDTNNFEEAYVMIRGLQSIIKRIREEYGIPAKP